MKLRQRIVDQPLLYLKVDEAQKAAVPEEDLTALRDVESVAGVCGRARKGFREGSFLRLPEARRPHLTAAWRETRLAFDALAGLIDEEGVPC